MIIKSVKFQFGLMCAMYLLFAAMVIVQMFFVYRRHGQDIAELRRTHEVISDYLKLDDEEGRIILQIRTHIANDSGPEAAARLNRLDEEIQRWFSRLELWKQKMTSWQVSANQGTLENSVFSQKFLDGKKRQANAYRKAVQCCREGKPTEAQHILNIEARFMTPVHDTIMIANQKVELRLENSLNTLQKFFFVMTMACLLALAVLIMAGTGIYRGLISSINKMDLAIKRISSGNFSSSVKISAPSELSFLANSFNSMQNTIKLRDGKIHEDAEDIKKINEFLEQKVISCNRTIEQQEIALGRKNEEIDMTLKMMSEELRSRIKELGEVVGNLHSNTENESSSKELDTAVKRLQSISQHLSELAGIGKELMHVQHLPMAAVFRNISEHLKFHLGMAGASLEVDDSIVDCQGDGIMLEQAFVKIVENAIKYRSPSRECKINISSEVDILFIRYKISDNGTGINAEFREKIFQAFFKINPDDGEGEGLGLAVVHRIVALHNGRVWVESRPGLGSTFIIELPKQQNLKR